MNQHMPDMTTWKCACGELWPCDTRRRQYLVEYAGRRTQLRVVMAAFLAEALRSLTPAEYQARGGRRGLLAQFNDWINLDNQHAATQQTPTDYR